MSFLVTYHDEFGEVHKTKYYTSIRFFKSNLGLD